jgi:predicted nucleic acid-binding protein
MTPVFLDTNVLLYAVTSAPQEVDKRDRARTLLEKEDWLLSVQVLQEFYVNAVRKIAQPLTPQAADRFIKRLLIRDPLPITSELMLAGVALSRRFRLSYWDGALIAAAKVLQCGMLYSEDLHHGQNFAGVQVINPFL